MGTLKQNFGLYMFCWFYEYFLGARVCEPSSGRATKKTRARATPFSSFQDGSWVMLLMIERETPDCSKYHAGSKAPGRPA